MDLTHNQFTISTDKTRLDVALIHRWLNESSYWAQGRSLETVQTSIEHSLCFGVYDDVQQVGFCRVVTDYATFGWLCDVFIIESHRGRGLSKRLVQAVVAQPELQGVRRLLLATRDAHELYRRYGGFETLQNPDRWMDQVKAIEIDMLNVEFHCHTIASKDSLLRPEKLIERCRQRGVDRVVITDHNVIGGALRAKELAPELVIVGEEIKTSCGGELLVAFVSQEIPRGTVPLDAIQRLRDQGAFISVSHPFDQFRSGAWKLPDLLKIAPLVDAIEIFNARCLTEGENQQAQAFARKHGLAGTAGSDAHALSEIGQATLLLPDFTDAASLKAVIAQGQVRGRLSPWWVHFYSTYAKWVKKSHVPSG